jgi:hypothetical protein
LWALDRQHLQLWIQPRQVVGVTGDDPLPRPVRADDDMGVDNVSSAGGGEQPTHLSGVHPIESDHVGGRLSGQSNESDLPFGTAYHLRENGRGQRDPGSGLGGSGQQGDDLSVSPLESDQSPCI